MLDLALHTERYFDEPWHTMYFFGDFFAEAEAGYIDKEDYQLKMDVFIKNKTLLCEYPSVKYKESFLKRFIRKIRGR